MQARSAPPRRDTPAGARSPGAARTASTVDRFQGTFSVTYAPARTEELQPWSRWFSGTGTLERVAARYNGMLRIPRDVEIRAEECGAVNAYWRPAQRQIVLCYEYVRRVFSETKGKLGEGAGASIIDFTLLHELGHAAISLYDLPITGRQEDAVDQLAVLLARNDAGAGRFPAYYAARYFGMRGERSGSNFADEHSLNTQRFYNIFCWIYGKDPAAHREIVARGQLTEARAKRCAGERRQIERSWSLLLAPYWKGRAAG